MNQTPKSKKGTCLMREAWDMPYHKITTITPQTQRQCHTFSCRPYPAESSQTQSETVVLHSQCVVAPSFLDTCSTGRWSTCYWPSDCSCCQQSRTLWT